MVRVATPSVKIKHPVALLPSGIGNPYHTLLVQNHDVPVFRQTHVCPPPAVIWRATPVEGVTVEGAPEILSSETVNPSSPAAIAGSATAATATV
jgi:hypothetical protein